MDAYEQQAKHDERRREVRIGMLVVAVLALIVGVVLALTVEPALGVVAFVVLLGGGVVAVRSVGEQLTGGPPGGAGSL